MGKGERERARPTSSWAWSPARGLIPPSVRSWPEWKSRVDHSIDWTTQVPLNEFSFASLILFGNRESEYIANYTLLMFLLLLCFHASLKFMATIAEGFFTYSACSRQGGSWYLGKLKLISAEKAFLWDCFLWMEEQMWKDDPLLDSSLCCCFTPVASLAAR